jgi:hypothetical protein
MDCKNPKSFFVQRKRKSQGGCEVDPRHTDLGTTDDNVETITGQGATKEKWKFFTHDTRSETSTSDQWRMGRGKLNL